MKTYGFVKKLLIMIAISLVGVITCSLSDKISNSGQEPGNRKSVLITADMRQNAVRNIERYEWARAYRDELQKSVDPYMKMDTEALWRLLPGQEIGRSVVTYSPHSQTSPHSKGCPQCYLNHKGKDIGPDIINIDLLGKPWQVQCKRCGTWFPKNDFEAYYKSALDKRGRFITGKGDPKYLAPREDVEGEAKKWIEDGMGVKYDGYQWFYAGAYAFSMWSTLPRIAKSLAILYTLTENPEYARRAAIIIDRMADLYPEMDERASREQGMFTSYGPGRVMGGGWEYVSIRIPIAEAYDYIYDGIRGDNQLVSFLNRMNKTFNGPDKSSFEKIDGHIRKNLLIEMAEDLLEGEIGVRGKGQAALTAIAVALNDPKLTPEYLDWLFKENGGRLAETLIEHLQRDGFNVNCGLGYMLSTGRDVYQIAEKLRKYGNTGYDIYTKFPMLLNSFTMLRRVRILDKFIPQVGDGGSSMSRGDKRLPLEMLVDGYRISGDKSIADEIAQHFKDNLDKVIRQNIYDGKPEVLMESIKAHITGESEPHQSYNSGGTGLAVLQSPWRDSERAAAIWYGRAMRPSHAHADRLTLHLFAFDNVMMPDMGYPEFTGKWPKRIGFTRHVISHNTLMINDTTQKRSYSGKTCLFADAGIVRIADIDGLGSTVAATHDWRPNVPYENARTYWRVATMVDTDETNSYLLDLFWARGGESHRLIQNAGSTEATYSELNMEKQETGTLAGKDVQYGEEYDGKLTAADYQGSGFQFLENVEHDKNPPEKFWIDWKIYEQSRLENKREVHMRLYNRTQLNEVALVDGKPSRGVPDRIRYSVRSRFGKNLNTQFISLIEPYMNNPFIKQVRVIERVENEQEPFAVAIEITLVDNRRDILLVREEPGQWKTGEFYLDGRIALIRFNKTGKVEKIVAIAAEEVRAGKVSVKLEPAVYKGTLVSYDDSDPRNVLLILSDPVLEDVVGQYIIFDNKEIGDGSYRIEAVKDKHTVCIGQMSIYERLADLNDFNAGVIYNIQPGEKYIIPRILVWHSE